MRTFHALCCVLLLWTASASAQSAPVKILIASRTQPASAGGDAQTVAGVFESFVLTQITKKYPCAEPVTMEDVRNLLTYDRTRQLLDPKHEGGLETIAGAMGANYYVSITVTSSGAGPMVVNASVINAANAQVVSRTGSTYASAEAASKAMGPLAQQLVQSMGSINRLSNCGGTWSGTIVYRKTWVIDEDTSTSPNEVRKNYMKLQYEATVTLSASDPKNVKAVVKSTLVQSNDSSTSGEQNCAKRPGIDDPLMKVLKHVRITNANASVNGTVDGTAEVTMKNGEARISVRIPAVDGGTYKETKQVSDDLCHEAPYVQHIPDLSVEWSSTEEDGTVTVPLDPKNPDQLSGTKEVRPGITIQWTLSKR